MRPLTKQTIARQFLALRRQTRALLDPLGDPLVEHQLDPLMSPLVWDLGHVAAFEELWLLCRLDGRAPRQPELHQLYNPVENPRWCRGSLPLPDRVEAMDFLGVVRRDVLELLESIELDAADPLRHDGFVYRMVLQHEAQHQETMLQTLDLCLERRETHPSALFAPLGAARDVDDAERVRIPTGPSQVGTDETRTTYDNERPAHVVELPAFWIDRFPVTVRRWLEFVQDGAYCRSELWCERGWSWLQGAGHAAPQGWSRDAGGHWHVRRFGHWMPLDPREPVAHVSCFEAEAFARWAGARLPSELEWEKAAAWDPRAGAARAYPWGAEPPSPEHANLGQRRWAPAPVGSFPLGASAYGVEQLLGDVYEWTSSEFTAYPGFAAFPYPEYSQIHFDRGYRVLRGASWATCPRVARNTFRNWDLPQRRQIFSGVRLAWPDEKEGA